MSLWKLMASDNISRHPKLLGRMDLLNAMVELGKLAARKTINDVGAQGFVEMRRLAPMVNWAKNARKNSSGCAPAQWVIDRGDKLLWSLLDD